MGQFDGNGQLYTTDSWEPFGRLLEAHTQRVTNVEFSGDRGVLATSSADGTVQLWDVATQEPIGSRLAVEPGTFVSAALTPDGSHLFAVSTAPRGLRLAVDPEVWKRHACVVAGRELTQREWKARSPGGRIGRFAPIAESPERRRRLARRSAPRPKSHSSAGSGGSAASR